MMNPRLKMSHEGAPDANGTASGAVRGDSVQDCLLAMVQLQQLDANCAASCDVSRRPHTAGDALVTAFDHRIGQFGR